MSVLFTSFTGSVTQFLLEYFATVEYVNLENNMLYCAFFGGYACVKMVLRESAACRFFSQSFNSTSALS